jgi:hypothetical protein
MTSASRRKEHGASIRRESPAVRRIAAWRAAGSATTLPTGDFLCIADHLIVEHSDTVDRIAQYTRNAVLDDDPPLS